MKVKAYAKINLYLDITGKRQDGYHTMEMIMQSVSLCDRIDAEKDLEISVFTEGVEQEKNLAYKAAKAFFARTGIKGGLKVVIEKNIPMQAGLGGGSADAAAVLVCANELYGRPLGEDELAVLGGTLGADVPFAVKGGTCIARGTGDELVKTANATDPVYVIVKPGGGVNTKEAFALYDSMDRKPGGDICACARALCAGDEEALCKTLYNALEPPAMQLCPQISDVKTALENEKGVKRAFMTGSGSAVIGICDNKAAAIEIKNKTQYKDLKVFIAKNTDSGIEML